MKTGYILLGCLLAATIISCESDDINPTETGSLILEFDTRAGDENFELNKDYENASGETFRLTKLNYYVSNIILTTTDGTDYVVPQDSSYFLIMEEVKESQKVRLNNIPVGNYNKVAFTIGVDSLRSTMDISKRHGVLNPAHGHDGMYWSWNSGYIFFKAEGISPAAPAELDHKFTYHIGGFGGYDTPTLNNIRETTVSLGNARAEVRTEKVPQVHFHADVLQFFANPTSLSIAENPSVMTFSEFSLTISENYSHMFRFDHVHN